MNNLLIIVLFCFVLVSQSRTYPSRFMAQDEGEVYDSEIEESNMQKLEKEEEQLQKSKDKSQKQQIQNEESIQNQSLEQNQSSIQQNKLTDKQNQSSKQNNQSYESKEVGEINYSNIDALRNKKIYESYEQNGQNYQNYLKKQQDDAAKKQELDQTVTIDSVIPNNYAFLRTNYKKPQKQEKNQNHQQKVEPRDPFKMNQVEQNQALPQYDNDLTKQDGIQFNTRDFFEEESLDQNRRDFQQNVMEHPGDYPQETIDQVAQEIQSAKTQQDYNQQDPQNLTPIDTTQSQQPPQFEQSNQFNEEIYIQPRFMKKHHKITQFHRIKSHHNFDRRRLRRKL